MNRYLESNEDESHEPVAFNRTVRCIGVTNGGALKLRDGEGFTFFVPQSVVHDDSEVHELSDVGTLTVQRWFAEKDETDGWAV